MILISKIMYLQVVLFTKRLLQFGLSPDEIGIITPYQLQVKQIRSQMEEFLQLDVFPKVGSVEEFQGQERMVILISTVRSNVREEENESRSNAGFIKNERRLNVAISRARQASPFYMVSLTHDFKFLIANNCYRAVVVVFGNPDLLEIDKNWKQLIDECKINGTFVGSKF